MSQGLMNWPLPDPRVPTLQMTGTVLPVHRLGLMASMLLLNVSATYIVPEGSNATAIGQLKLLVSLEVFGQLVIGVPSVLNSSIRLLRVFATHTFPFSGS